MVKILSGNIFKTNCECIVNTINCVGFMGKGIALEFSLRYPKMELEYKQLCQHGDIQIGHLWLYDQEKPKNKVLNFPTKQDYKFPTRIEYIQSGLEYFAKSYKNMGIKSIAFPMLGTNNGKLNHQVALNLMLRYLDNLEDIDIEIYAHTSADDKTPDNYFRGFCDFLSLYDNAKYIDKVNYINSHPSIDNFSKLVETKIHILREDGSSQNVSLFTKPRLQKLVNDFDSVSSAADYDLPMFTGLK